MLSTTAISISRGGIRLQSMLVYELYQATHKIGYLGVDTVHDIPCGLHIMESLFDFIRGVACYLVCGLF